MWANTCTRRTGSIWQEDGGSGHSQLSRYVESLSQNCLTNSDYFLVYVHKGVEMWKTGRGCTHGLGYKKSTPFKVKKGILFFYNQRSIVRLCSKMNYAYTREGDMVMRRRQEAPCSDIHCIIHDWIRIRLYCHKHISKQMLQYYPKLDHDSSIPHSF
jgi:hypothetical protein